LRSLETHLSVLKSNLKRLENAYFAKNPPFGTGCFERGWNISSRLAYAAAGLPKVSCRGGSGWHANAESARTLVAGFDAIKVMRTDSKQSHSHPARG
jgi:hypothetical protein